MSPYKIMICGCGGAGYYAAKTAVADGRGEVVGLFDPRQEQRSKLAELYPVAVQGADYEALLKQTQPDIVIIASPDHLHADQAILALEHGSHVLVEKPLATTVEDAQRILDTEARTGLQVMTDHTVRYMSPWKEMARLVQTGDIGRVFFVEGNYIHDMLAYYSAQGRSYTPWRVDQQNPQNILLGGGCHPIDLMLWAVGERVTEVFAYSNKLSVPEFPSDDCYILLLKFENEVMGKIFVTSGCSAQTLEGEIGGGYLAAYGVDGTLWRGKRYRRGEEPVAIDLDTAQTAVGGHGWGGSVVAFLDCLDGKTPNPIPARNGARVVSVCEAALKAIQTGQPQKPEWFDTGVGKDES